MPVYYWAIGLTFLILGIIILIYAYRKYEAGSYTKKPSEETTVSGEETIVTDEEMRKSYKTSKLMFIIGWIMVAASAPFLLPMIYAGYFEMVGLVFSIGTALGLLGTWFIIMYKTNPEKFRLHVAKRKKRKMKKKT